jgi:hypothetical protein
MLMQIFAGTYRDSLNTDRGVRFLVDYIPEIVGYSKNTSYDLTIFKAQEHAAIRLVELAKYASTPQLTIIGSLPLRYLDLYLGDCIKVTGLFGHVKDFLVTRIEKNVVDGNIKIEGRETLFKVNDFTPLVNETSYVPKTYNPLPLSQVEVVTDFYFSDGLNVSEGLVPCIVVGERADAMHTGIDVYMSVDGEDYSFLGATNTFGNFGVLGDSYAGSFFPKMYVEMNDPAYTPESLSMFDFLNSRRILLIDGQVFAFEGAGIDSEGLFLENVHSNSYTEMYEGQGIAIITVDSIFKVPSQIKYLTFCTRIGSRVQGLEEGVMQGISLEQDLPGLSLSGTNYINEHSEEKRVLFFVSRTGFKDGCGVLPPASTSTPGFLWSVVYRIDGGSWESTHDSFVDMSEMVGDFLVEAHLSWKGLVSPTVSINFSREEYFFSNNT